MNPMVSYYILGMCHSMLYEKVRLLNKSNKSNKEGASPPYS